MPGSLNRVFVVLALCFFLLTGCDKYTNYKVLTVFFTGVPHPDEALWPAEKTIRVARTEKKSSKPQSPFYVHGPFGARQCYQCHETAEPPGVSFQSDSQRSVPRLPGKLLSPLKKICSECHVTKSAQSAYSRDLWIHGPASDGMCTLCHHPHRTKFPSLLTKGDPSELCRSCHGQGYLMETEEHTSGEACGNCHNAHLGKTRFLLKKDFEEIY